MSADSNPQFFSFMQYAISLAKEAAENNEVPVGCIIVERKSNEIIAKTYNNMQKLQNSIAHAEILAINEACKLINNKSLANCDMYVTLEPCTMCAAAISNARISRLFYASDDIKQGAVENGVRYFTSSSCFHRPEIYSGIGNAESRKLMQDFFKKIRQDKL